MSSSTDGQIDRALADTSVFIAAATGRLTVYALPPRLSVSMITIGELRVGVLAASSTAEVARRLETYLRAERLDPIPVDGRVAKAWAQLRVDLRASGRRLAANDSWIAATAIAHGLPIVTQDADYDDVPGLTTIRL